MNKLHQDIIIAQKLVSGSKSNINGTAFHNTSVIYKGTNEKQVDYHHHILGKKDKAMRKTWCIAISKSCL